MPAKPAQFPLYSSRLGSWRAVMRRFTPTNLFEIALSAWVLLLVVMPMLVFSQLPARRMEQVRVEIHGHLLIETFCGFVALMISGMVLVMGVKRRNPSFILFGLGFLAMGSFDILHAWTDPFEDQNLFVFYHSLSTLLGSAFILAGVVASVFAERERAFSRADLITAIIGVLLVVVVATLYRVFIPRLIPHDASYFSFADDTHTLHYLAGILYAMAAIVFYRHFRRHGEVLALVISSLLVLFAQSAYLFSFSSMWNLAWWVWHGVKVVFYLGVMVTIFISYMLALRTIEGSRRVLARANNKLQRSQEAIQRFNQALKIRNRMAQEAMASPDLDNALDEVAKAIRKLFGLTCGELILNVPPDEVDEFERRVPRMSRRWQVRARRKEGCFGDACHSLKHAKERLFECGYRDAGGRASVCLSLSASGEQIGFLRLMGEDPGALRRSTGPLRALAPEVGAIVHNALLNHNRQEANAFRMAILRVSTMLTSTLKLDEVVESVCEESAALLESDGALVWLPGQDPESFSLVARWFAGIPPSAGAEQDAWCRDGKFCASLLQGIDGEYQPRDILWHEEPHLAAFTRPPNCPWESIALFPLVDEASLIGVMMLVRRDKVRYSAATLAKGELLAGQVRIAINNARSYQRLTEINHQLKLAEEHRSNAERLAALGQMAASVAHEVRNPLSAIANCLAVLKVGTAGEDARGQAALDIIQDEVERLSSLTSNFLTFGKPRAITKKVTILESVMHRMCLALERHIAQEGLSIKVEVDTPSSSTRVLFDTDGLDTVLWNLLLNASQAIHDAGRIELRLRLYPGYFLIGVVDTGKGIAREDQARIFEPFYSQRSLGAGLGLAIVQRTVREWGGQIRVRSQAGVGAAFFVRAPMPKESAEQREAA